MLGNRDTRVNLARKLSACSGFSGGASAKAAGAAGASPSVVSAASPVLTTPDADEPCLGHTVSDNNVVPSPRWP